MFGGWEELHRQYLSHTRDLAVHLMDGSPCVWGFAEELVSANMSYNPLRSLLSGYGRNNSYAGLGLHDLNSGSQGCRVITPFGYLHF